MKKILLLALTAILVSCGTTQYAINREIPTFTDFRPYTDNGFFISPGISGVKYKPIGIVSFVFIPGVKDPKNNKYQMYKENVVDAYGYRVRTNIPDSVFRKQKDISDGFFQPDEAYMIGRVVEYAKGIGATGLLNYKIVYDYSLPSPISSHLDKRNKAYTTVIAHPDQTYGSACITVFAVEIINE